MRLLIFWSLLSVLCLVEAGSKIPTAVLELNEKFLEVMNQGFWFVKFYAPWCGHCKRLAPTWEHLGHALADKNPNIRVAKVDCTRFPSVANELRVHGYPTIIFFRNGVQILFEGERKKETMLQFAEKSAGPVISNFESKKTFYELKKNSDKEPFFVYLDQDEEKASEQYLLNEYKAASEELFTEVLLLVEPEELIGAINKSSESGKFYQIFKKAAMLSFHEPSLKANFQFGVLEENSLANNIVMGQLNLVVLNLTSYEFYLSEDKAQKMTEQSIKIFLENLLNGNVSVQGGRAWSTRLKRIIYDITTNVYDMFYHQPILTVCLFGVPLAFFSIIAYSVCSADFSVDRDEIYPADEEDEDEEGVEIQGEDITSSEAEDEQHPLLDKDYNHQKAE